MLKAPEGWGERNRRRGRSHAQAMCWAWGAVWDAGVWPGAVGVKEEL